LMRGAVGSSRSETRWLLAAALAAEGFPDPVLRSLGAPARARE